MINAIEINGSVGLFKVARKKLNKLGFNVKKLSNEVKNNPNFGAYRLLIGTKEGHWRLQSHLLSDNIISIETLLKIKNKKEFDNCNTFVPFRELPFNTFYVQDVN